MTADRTPVTAAGHACAVDFCGGGAFHAGSAAGAGTMTFATLQEPRKRMVDAIRRTRERLRDGLHGLHRREAGRPPEMRVEDLARGEAYPKINGPDDGSFNARSTPTRTAP